MRLSPTQRRVLTDLAAGGCFFAALREPDEFLRDGIIFSERVGIVVHPVGGDLAQRYRVRNRTAGPLYLCTPALVDSQPGDSGFRQFRITAAGQALLASG